MYIICINCSSHWSFSFITLLSFYSTHLTNCSIVNHGKNQEKKTLLANQPTNQTKSLFPLFKHGRYNDDMMSKQSLSLSEKAKKSFWLIVCSLVLPRDSSSKINRFCVVNIFLSLFRLKKGFYVVNFPFRLNYNIPQKQIKNEFYVLLFLQTFLPQHHDTLSKDFYFCFFH